MMPIIGTKFSLKIMLIVWSVIVFLIILLVGEMIVRRFSSITFQGVSSDLFISDAYGSSKGNIKNSKKICFGEDVYTDAYGFRISEKPNMPASNYTQSVLILGDSVGFGVGVRFEKTFTGLLAQDFPCLKIYNSSVIGYNVDDYKDVIDFFLPHHKSINEVFLVFCLNDISSRDAVKIHEMLQASGKKEYPKKNKDFLQWIRQFKSIENINIFLRSRSKLYLLIKGMIFKPHKMYWDADRALYIDVDKVNKCLAPVKYINDALNAQNIKFTVIIVPYEYQMRVANEMDWLPQKRLISFFEMNNIAYIDVAPRLIDQHKESYEFFLKYDPMHLSERGHETVYEIIKGEILCK